MISWNQFERDQSPRDSASNTI